MHRMTDASIDASVMSTNSGFLLVLALVIPLAGALLAFVCGGRHVDRIALGVMPLGLAIALAIAIAYASAGGTPAPATRSPSVVSYRHVHDMGATVVPEK